MVLNGPVFFIHSSASIKNWRLKKAAFLSPPLCGLTKRRDRERCRKRAIGIRKALKDSQGAQIDSGHKQTQSEGEHTPAAKQRWPGMAFFCVFAKGVCSLRLRRGPPPHKPPHLTPTPVLKPDPPHSLASVAGVNAGTVSSTAPPPPAYRYHQSPPPALHPARPPAAPTQIRPAD